MVEQVGLLLRAAGMVEQVAHEQGLVAGGGDLGYEDDVVRIARGLVGAAQVGVDAVAHLVHEGEDVIELALEVHENDGVHAVAARAVGTAALARGLVDVNPALAQALAHDVQVVLAQGGQRLEDELAGLLVAEVHVDAGHHGHVEVVEAQLVEAQHAFAQGRVLVQRCRVGVHCLDELGVHLHRHLVGVESRLERRAVAAGVCEELQLLHLVGHDGGRGVAELPVCAVERAVGACAQGAVLAHEQGDVAAMGDGVRLAVAVDGVFKAHVCIVEHGEGVLRRASSAGPSTCGARRKTCSRLRR